MMPKVSVIVPLYNASNFVVVCLNSLVAQILTDIEVVLVDDHSTDNTLEVVQRYICEHKLENRFILTQTEQNSGPGIARNKGLTIATGEYVAFLDCDDWVNADMYEQLYKTATQYQADLCYCNAVLDKPNTPPQLLQNPIVSNGDFTSENKNYFLTHFMALCVSFLYKRSFLQTHNLQFPEGKSAEDSYWLTHCLLNAQKIANMQNAAYHYVVRSNSLTQTTDENRYKQKIFIFGRLLESTKSYSNERAALEYIYIKKGFVIPMFNYLKSSRSRQANVIKENANLLIERIPTYLQNKYYKKDFMCQFSVQLLVRTPKLAVLILPLMLRFSKYNTVI